MTVRLSIYDFFAYTIPGGVILAIPLYLSQTYKFLQINLLSVSLLELIGLGILAYLIGHFIEPISRNIWYKIFLPKNLYEDTLANFKERNPDISVISKGMDWYILFSYVKKHNLEMSQDLERINVMSKMLRNSSFAILLFAIVFAFEFFTLGYLMVYAVAWVLCLIVSIVLVKQAVHFKEWFYEGIYQSLVALVLAPEQLPVRVEDNKVKSTSSQKETEKP